MVQFSFSAPRFTSSLLCAEYKISAQILPDCGWDVEISWQAIFQLCIKFSWMRGLFPGIRQVEGWCANLNWRHKHRTDDRMGWNTTDNIHSLLVKNEIQKKQHWLSLHAVSCLLDNQGPGITKLTDYISISDGGTRAPTSGLWSEVRTINNCTFYPSDINLVSINRTPALPCADIRKMRQEEL